MEISSFDWLSAIGENSLQINRFRNQHSQIAIAEAKRFAFAP
jgi:hypothetical protein